MSLVDEDTQAELISESFGETEELISATMFMVVHCPEASCELKVHVVEFILTWISSKLGILEMSNVDKFTL